MISGECFCGAVTYQYTGKLTDARSCHCSRCRKAFSAQASAYALVDFEKFSWVTGQSLLTTYRSQEDFGLQFCSQCGSTLCATYQEKLHGVTLGCVNGEPDVEIERHIFVGSKANWETMPDNVKQFNGAAPEN